MKPLRLPNQFHFIPGNHIFDRNILQVLNYYEYCTPLTGNRIMMWRKTYEDMEFVACRKYNSASLTTKGMLFSSLKNLKNDTYCI